MQYYRQQVYPVPDLLDFGFDSLSSLTTVVGGASTLVTGISTVALRDATGEDEVAGLEGCGGGKGKFDPAGKEGLPNWLLNWLFCESICPIKVLKACCIAYF